MNQVQIITQLNEYHQSVHDFEIKLLNIRDTQEWKKSLVGQSLMDKLVETHIKYVEELDKTNRAWDPFIILLQRINITPQNETDVQEQKQVNGDGGNGCTKIKKDGTRCNAPSKNIIGDGGRPQRCGRHKYTQDETTQWIADEKVKHAAKMDEKRKELLLDKLSLEQKIIDEHKQKIQALEAKQQTQITGIQQQIDEKVKKQNELKCGLSPDYLQQLIQMQEELEQKHQEKVQQIKKENEQVAAELHQLDEKFSRECDQLTNEQTYNSNQLTDSWIRIKKQRRSCYCDVSEKAQIYLMNRMKGTANGLNEETNPFAVHFRF